MRRVASREKGEWGRENPAQKERARLGEEEEAEKGEKDFEA